MAKKTIQRRKKPVTDNGHKTEETSENGHSFVGANTGVGPPPPPFRDELGRFLQGNSGTLKYHSDPEEVKRLIVEYFEECQTKGKRPNVTGLALALGFQSRSSLVNYQRQPGYEQFHDLITWAKMKIEEALEDSLVEGKDCSVIGIIFALKQQGWTDRQDIRVDQRTLNIEGFQFIEPKQEENENTDYAND